MTEKELIHWSTFDFQIGFKADPVAALAWEILKTHPLLPGVPAGEDSKGRAKIRNMTAVETVQRAFDLAELFMNAARKRAGAPIPTPVETAVMRGEYKRTEYEAQFPKAKE